MALEPFVGPWPLFQFLNPYTVGRTPWTGDQPVARPLPTQTQNKRTQTSMPWVGFEPTIPAFKRAKTVHALDCAATLIGILPYTSLNIHHIEKKVRRKSLCIFLCYIMYFMLFIYLTYYTSIFVLWTSEQVGLSRNSCRLYSGGIRFES
jgi:hypothetical protein